MRLKSITIEGFRAFGSTTEIVLDADVIVLQGNNGVGKTSLLDAILWALAGRIARFEDRGSPVSIYAREGLARVELTLTGDAGDLVIVRATDGSKSLVRLRYRGEEAEGAAAEQRLCNLLLPHLKDRAEAQAALGSVLTRGVYLQQDLVRQFVEVDSAAERFALVSEVIGAGVVLELQQALEKSRNQWSRSTSALRRDDLDPLRAREARIEEQLARLSDGSSSGSADARQASEALHLRAVALLGQGRLGIQEPPTTPGSLDQLLKQLGAERARVEREVASASSLAEELSSLAGSGPVDQARVDALAADELRISEELAIAEEAIEQEIKRLAADRERQVETADRANRMATLARLALQDLGGRCPVCEQVHDVEHTQRHLETLIAASTSTPVVPRDDMLNTLNAARTDLSRQLEAVRTESRGLADRERERKTRRSLLAARLGDFDVNADGDVGAQLEGRRAETLAVLEALSELVREGERLSLSVLRLGELRRRDELAGEQASIMARISALTRQAEAQDRTHATAGLIIEGLRGAALSVTQRQIKQIEPLFQRIYSRIDPHPTFRVTQITAGLERGKGQLNVGILDPDAGAQPRDAGPLLSSSQLNSYAVSLFLAMNLALPSLKLNVTILDDPLQSLDSINLLGLVDVLRRFRAHRQIIVSTHEDRLVGLLQRKLRPIREGEHMITMLLEQWSKNGPAIRTIRTEYAADEERVLAA